MRLGANLLEMARAFKEWVVQDIGRIGGEIDGANIGQQASEEWDSFRGDEPKLHDVHLSLV